MEALYGDTLENTEIVQEINATNQQLLFKPKIIIINSIFICIAGLNDYDAIADLDNSSHDESNSVNPTNRITDISRRSVPVKKMSFNKQELNSSEADVDNFLDVLYSFGVLEEFGDPLKPILPMDFQLCSERVAAFL